MSRCLRLEVSLRNFPVTRTICSKSFKNSLPGKKKAEAMNTWLVLREQRGTAGAGVFRGALFSRG